jgi:ATP-dependent DNA helicase RecQ
VFFIQRGELSDQAIATVAMRLQARAHEGRYDLGADELSAVLDGDTRDNDDTVRAVIGHLARAGVIRPAPSSPDRIRGRIEGPFDGRARAACRTSAGESTRARWSQYRSVWRFVEGDACRRTAILRHFGDRSTPAPMEGVPCCDVCDPAWVPAAPAAKSSRRRPAGAPPVAAGDLDAAIVEVVETADPAVGRTRAVEILRGGRSQALVKSGHDGLPAYGTFDHLTAQQVMARVDELLHAGRLRSTGGMYPKLAPADPPLETAA